MKKITRALKNINARIKWFFTEKSVVKNLWLLCFIVFISVIGMFVIFRSTAEHAMLAFANRYNEELFVQTQDKIDDSLNIMYKAAARIVEDKKTDSVLRSYKTLSGEEYYNLKKDYNTLIESYVMRESLSMSAEICGIEDDIMISESGIYPYKDGMERVFEGDVQKAFEIIKKGRDSFFSSGNRIVYLKFSNDKRYCVLISVDKLWYFDYLRGAYKNFNGKIFVYDKDGMIAVTVGDDNGIPEKLHEYVTDNEKFSQIKYDGKTYIVNTVKSKVNGWKMYMFFDKNEYLKELVMLENVFYIVFLCIIILFIIIMGIYVKNTYKPFKQFISYFDSAEYGKEKNEYEYERVIRAYKKLKDETISQEKMIYNHEKSIFEFNLI